MNIIKKKSMLFISLGILIIAFSCSKEESLLKEDTSLAGDSIQIRIKNASEYMYTDVVFDAGNCEFKYDSISPNQTLNFEPCKLAYEQAGVSLKIEGDGIYAIIPIDHIGENKLVGGKYTYEISAHEIDFNTLLFTDDDGNRYYSGYITTKLIKEN